MMTSKIPHVLAAALLASIAACAGPSRNVAAYRADTASLLESRRPELRACYEQALAGDTQLAGTVTIQFTVQSESGVIKNPTIDPTRSTATPALGACVIKAIDGLVLSPPDRNEGRATYVYEFRPDAPPTAAPAA
ncbi:MAG: AgmX/PglI C-terminal domain-containing protein [Myxococcales bacterium]|nr:AgmX/PglI C-terminal domain-containing protein [Myxococcales bacterium]